MGERTEPLESLGREHRLIAQVLDALEGLAARLQEEDDRALVGDLGQFVGFLTAFAEGAHHVKEEDILLPFLARHGFAWDTGPLREIRADHDQERYFMRVLEQAAGQEAPWSREDRRHAVATVRAFVEFERNHLKKENTSLFPAVVERLKEAELAVVDEALESFRDRFGAESYDELTANAERLVERYTARVG